MSQSRKRIVGLVVLAIQLPALLAVVLILIRGRYSAHPLIFWMLIVLPVLAISSWFFERSLKSGRLSMILELARILAVTSSWIISIVGVVMAFI